MAGPRRIYLDTNAIIHFIENRQIDVMQLFERAAEGRFHIVTSELTLAEVLVIPCRRDDAILVRGYDDFLKSDASMTVMPVDRPVLVRSAQIRARHGGTTPDAIHGATAELAGCRVVVSSDKRLKLPEGLVRVDILDAARIGADQ